TQPGGQIVADHLEATISGAVALTTRVNSISLETTASGDAVITQPNPGSVSLVDIRILDGKLDVVANGSVTADNVQTLTNSDANDISLSSGGDLLVGWVSAGLHATNQAEADVLRLALLNGALGGLDPGALPSWMVQAGKFVDLSLVQARSLIPPEPSVLLNLLTTAIAANGVDLQSAGEEAQRLVGLTSDLTSQGDLTLTAGGAISEIGAGDAAADLVGDQLHLTAQSGISGLETAVRTVLYAQTAAGPIELTDQDGIGDASAGLNIVEAYAVSGSITVQSEETLVVGRVEALNPGASVSLASERGHVIVPALGWVKAGSGAIIHAGRDILVADVVSAPDRLEFRAGGQFSTVGFDLALEADTVIVEVGTSIDVTGTLRATTLLELISNLGNITILGAIEGIGGGDLKQLSLIARGNLITSGNRAGYYEYQANGLTYYMDRQDVVYQQVGSALSVIANPEDLNLIPVLKEEIRHLRNRPTGMHVYQDSSGRWYHSRFELDGGDLVETFYQIFDHATGYYTFNGYYDQSGEVETFYSSSQVVTDGNGDILPGVVLYGPDNAVLSNPNLTNVQPSYVKLTDAAFIASLSPVMEIISTGNITVDGGSLAIARDFVRFNAQHNLNGIGLGLTATGAQGEIEITTGGDILFNAALRANNKIALTSTGYVSIDGVTTAGDVTINGSILGHNATLQEVFLSALGDLNLNASVSADRVIELQAGGNIVLSQNLDTSHSAGQIALLAENVSTINSARVTTHELEVVAGSAATLSTNVDLLEVAAGNISIAELNSTTLQDITATAGSIVIAAGGQITSSTTVTASQNVQLDSAAIVLINGSVAAGANVTLDADSNVTINGSVTSGGNVDVQAGNNANVNTSGVIATSGGSIAIDAARNSNVSGSIGSGGGAIGVSAQNTITLSGSIDTQSGTAALTLTADADTSGGGGVVMADGSIVDATGGSILISATDDIVVSQLVTTSNVSVTSSLGAILDTSDGLGNEIDAASAVLRAGTGIGSGVNPLETSISRLEADAGVGGLWLDNVGDMTIGGITSLNGIAAAASVDLSAASSLTVSEAIVSVNGPVALDASIDITVAAPISIASGSGAVVLAAGRDVRVNAAVTGRGGIVDIL
ncbi:MAG: hypothetical protein HOH74_21795, partial [Gemmatimonadetes bacterium]|nr:hypothetical protein [Gemmatimonadota bacterium]